MKKKLQLLLSAIALQGFAYPACAQGAGTKPAEDSSADAQLEEIIVTGTKRAGGENVQRVPVAITAFGAPQIEARFFRNIQDIGAATPNVMLVGQGTAPGYAGFTIRGLGVNSTIPSLDPTVGVFVDGIYMGVPGGLVLDNFDLAGVEILRGPQGLLFGRNVTGGAVVIRTTTPTFEWTGNFKASVETGLNKVVSGVLSGPIVPDLVAAKLAVYYNDDDGWFRNVTTGRSVNKLEQYVIRPAIRIQPRPGFTFDIRYEYGKTTGDGVVNQNHAVFSRKSFKVGGGDVGFTKQHWHQFIMETNLQVGSGTITNIAGYRHYSNDSQVDIDGLPQPFFRLGIYNLQDQFSDELRYSGKIGPVDLTAGLYYFLQDLNAGEQRLIGGTTLVSGGGKQNSNTQAIFGSADWHVSDTITVNLGGRYTWEYKKAQVALIKAGGCNYEARYCAPVFRDSKRWRAFTPKIGLQWEPDSDSQLYGFFTRGFRSGGYNLRNLSTTVPPGPFDQERMDSFEAGAKHSFGGGSRINLAAFRNRIHGLQREVQFIVGTSIVQVIRNTATVDVTGFEAEGQLKVTPSLILNGSVGYVHSNYKKIIFDLNRDNVINALDYALRLPRLAPWTYGFGFTFDHELGNIGTITARSNFSHRDDAFHTDANLGHLGSANLLDASLGLSLPTGIRVSVYGKNLLNDVYFSADPPQPVSFGGPGASGSAINKGRVIGAEVRYSF